MRCPLENVKPNRFVKRMKEGLLVVLLDPHVAKVFTSTEEVNNALRALISAISEHRPASLLKSIVCKA